MAEVRISPEVQAQIDDLPKRIRLRMERVVVRLADWPRVSGAKPLRGDLAGHYRVRTGDYRLQFHVRLGDKTQQPPIPDVVLIEKVGHRDGFYEE